MLKKCPECGSTEIISDLIVFAQGGNAGARPIYVTLIEPEPAKRPFVWSPKTETTGFRTSVCGECGHTELYTHNFKELLAAHKQGYVSRQVL
jgi:predicted nucleic-acid-binding Zn-ribbon protein